MPDSLTAAEISASTPERLAALCQQWQAEEREIWITLRGGSMSPTILPGTRFCLRCHTDLPTVGEIIAYRQGNVLVVHRLVEIAGAPDALRLICLGDGNVVPDLPVPANGVVGTVTAISPMPLPKRTLFALRHPRRHGRYLMRLLRKKGKPPRPPQ